VTVLMLGINKYFETSLEKKRALLILFPAILLSAYNLQSNTLLGGCILLSFYLLSRNKMALSALLLAICFFIKGYGICAAILFILYKRKANFIAWLVVLLCLFTLLPLIYLPFGYLVSCYKDWIHVLSTVHLNLQCSVGGFFRQCFNIQIPDGMWAISGVVIFLLPLTHISYYKNDQFRRLLAASLLIFIILFNKMAEIPTYIIATAGVCIWANTHKKLNSFDQLLVYSLVLITILSLPLWPRILLDNLLIRYSIIVIPFSLIWLKIQYELWKIEFTKIKTPELSPV
jgi:hypothetical protein